MRVLVTGAAGFIGSNLVDALLARGDQVVGLDNFDPYYEPEQKRRNLGRARAQTSFSFVEADVRDRAALGAVFGTARPELVVHLAARAGVRASVAEPLLYTEVNELGGANVLSACHEAGNVPLLYASTSSVYGKTERLPFVEDDPANMPLSPYAASKRSGELMAYAFSEVYRLPVCVLRFFTVYGPRGRPDMGFFQFTRALLAGRPITLFGEDTARDFTYVDDIVAGVLGAARFLSGAGGFSTFNLGRSEPVVVRRVIELLASHLGVEPKIELGSLMPGEAVRTAANVDRAAKAFGYQPQISIEEGVRLWVDWISNSPEAPSLASG